MKNLKTKLSYAIYTLLCVVLFMACREYPHHTVALGRQNCIVFKAEKVDNVKYGTFKYAVTDASGKGWTLYTFKEYKVGDTLKINNMATLEEHRKDYKEHNEEWEKVIKAETGRKYKECEIKNKFGKGKYGFDYMKMAEMYHTGEW